jgi:hypothetical protein
VAEPAFWRLGRHCGERFEARFLQFQNPELQRAPKTHPVTTPRFNVAFVKLVNFDKITTYYDETWKGREK